MNTRSFRSSPLLSFPLLSLLVGLAACSSESSGTDAAVDTGPTPLDTPPTDTPRADVPVTDVPVTDVPVTDVPRTDVPASDACARPDIARLPARIDCGPRGTGEPCPTGYACLSFSGVVLQQFCGRACRADCECPAGERCGSYSDKAGMHPLCVADNAGGP